MESYLESITDDKITMADVREIRDGVAQILHLSRRAYGAQAIEADRKLAKNLQEVADKIERRLSI